MPVSRSKRPLASTASRACEPISASTASIRARSSSIEVAAHLGPQRLVALARVVVAARGVDEDAGVRLAAVPLGQQAEQRLALDLRDRVPDRHVDGADGDRALAVPAGLLVRHHGRPDLGRVDVVAGVVHQALGVRFEDAVAEALADQPALAVAAVGVEAVADDRPAVAHHVGDHGHEARRHLAEIDIGVADGRGDRLRDLADFDNAHWAYLLCQGRPGAPACFFPPWRRFPAARALDTLAAGRSSNAKNCFRYAHSASTMELNWLEDFLALAEHRNFSRAAEARHVTQPAFSRRIRALEAWVGTPLVVRSPQGVALNAAGEYLRERAAGLTRDLHQMRRGALN